MIDMDLRTGRRREPQGSLYEGWVCELVIGEDKPLRALAEMATDLLFVYKLYLGYGRKYPIGPGERFTVFFLLEEGAGRPVPSGEVDLVAADNPWPGTDERIFAATGQFEHLLEFFKRVCLTEGMIGTKRSDDRRIRRIQNGTIGGYPCHVVPECVLGLRYEDEYTDSNDGRVHNWPLCGTVPRPAQEESRAAGPSQRPLAIAAVPWHEPSVAAAPSQERPRQHPSGAVPKRSRRRRLIQAAEAAAAPEDDDFAWPTSPDWSPFPEERSEEEEERPVARVRPMSKEEAMDIVDYYNEIGKRIGTAPRGTRPPDPDYLEEGIRGQERGEGGEEDEEEPDNLAQLYGAVAPAAARPRRENGTSFSSSSRNRFRSPGSGEVEEMMALLREQTEQRDEERRRTDEQMMALMRRISELEYGRERRDESEAD